MIYFVSDAHIGSLAMGDNIGHQQRFVALLKDMMRDAEAIYLVGDIFDFWYEYLWSNEVHFRQFSLVLDALRDAAECCEVHYFIGNHDIWTFGWLERRTGVRIHRAPEVVTLYGKRCYIAHGDGLVPKDMMKRYPKEVRRKIKRFMMLRRFFHNPVPQFLFSLVPPAWGDKFGYAWARKSREKELCNPCGYKGENNEELVLYAKEHEQSEHCDYYIFGHRHIELDLELATRARVVILGDFFRQFTYARMEKGNLTLEYDER